MYIEYDDNVDCAFLWFVSNIEEQIKRGTNLLKCDLLYNTGARAQEIVDLDVSDICLDPVPISK